MNKNDVVKTCIGDLLILSVYNIDGVDCYRVKNLKNNDYLDVTEFTIAYWVRKL